MAGISSEKCRNMFETTMLILGFDVAACEKNFKVTFSRDMFTQLNKKGSEVVLHFLFNRLDSSLAYEEFRDCWPVYTKKNDAEFRKRCSAWLERIAKEEPSSKLPRHTASLLMSPGGDRFYIFLMRFSSHVLRMVTLRLEKLEQIYISSFITSPGDHTPALKEVTKQAMKAHIVRHTQTVVNRMEVTGMLHEEWMKYASQLTTEYLTTSKQIREAKKKLSGLVEARKDRASAGTPQGQSSADEQVRTLTAEMVERQRASRMAKVKELWSQFDEFFEQSAYHCEVIQSILDGEANKHSFDARTVALKIPEVIMREYERQNGEKMESPYQEGKLNLISLIRLWNCSLRLLRDKLVENEIPCFDTETCYLEEQHEKHSLQLTTVRELRSSLAELKESVHANTKKLEANLQRLRGKPQFQATGKDNTQPLMLYIPPITVPSLEFDLTPPPTPPDQITCSTTQQTSPVPLPMLGFDLLSPSPPRAAVSTTPNTKMVSSHIGSKLRDEVSTPEAIHNISESVRMRTQQQQPTKSSETKIPFPKKLMTSQSAPKKTPISQNVSIKPPVSQNTQIKTAVSQNVPIKTPISQHVPKKPPVSQKSIKKPPTTAKHPARKVPSSQSPVSTTSVETRTLKTQLVSASSKLTISQRHQQTSDGTQPGSGLDTPLLESMPKAHVILAEQIAAAVATGRETSDSSLDTPDAMMHSLTDPVSAMGTDAFISRDKILRTPLRKDVGRLQFDTPADHLSPSLQEELSCSPSHSSEESPPNLFSPNQTTPYFQTPVKQQQTSAFNTPANSLEFLSNIEPPTPYHLISDPEWSSQEAVQTLLEESHITQNMPPPTDDLIHFEDSEVVHSVFPQQPTATPPITAALIDFQPLHTSTAIDKLKFGPGASEPAEQPSD